MTGLFSMYWRNFCLFAVSPETKLRENIGTKFLIMSVDSRTALSMTGNITFSSNWPDWAARATVVSFPTMLKQIMFMHSASDGLTLPGMMEEPAWTAGIPNSESPATGPDAINLISFENLPSSSARFLKVDETFETANLLCRPYCMSGSGFSGIFVIFASSNIATDRYPFGVFAPLPTAVQLRY